MSRQLHIFPAVEPLSQAAADQFVQIGQTAVAQRQRFLVALSGGGTPKALYNLLATPAYARQLPWAQTFIFWGDERLVPPDDAESSYGMTAQHLLAHVPIPPQNLYRALGEADAPTAVADYQAKLAQMGEPWPQFDLILLGMGHDGHTASLFPGPLPHEAETNSVIAVTANYDGRPAQRITFTPRLINRARHIFFLVTGAAKAPALKAAWHGPTNPEQWPVQRIQPEAGQVSWFVDQAAAAEISEG